MDRLNDFKTRFYLVCAAGGIGLFVIVLYFTLPGIKAAREYNNLEKKITHIRTDEGTLQHRLSELNRYNDYLFSGTETALLQHLFGQVSHTCDSLNVQVDDFKTLSVKTVGNWTVVTHFFSIRSGYKDLVSALYAIEKNSKGSRVNSVVFKSLLNRSTRRKELKGDVYIQSIVRNSNEWHENS